ncbi:MAG: IclR family transcriptional regulator [Terrimesophilobacter sp.]
MPKESKSAATVDRALDVLMHFVDSKSDTIGVTEIATAMGMSKATVHRVLSSLRRKGFVRFEEKTRRYALGPTNATVGLNYLSRLDVRRLSMPVMARLSAETNETATLSIMTGNTRVYADQVTPQREVIMSVPIGIPFPLHAGSSSKAFLANLSSEQIEEYLAEPLQSLTPHTLTDINELRKELAQIREDGVAHSIGERQSGASSVAAPVFDSGGTPVAVISICGPSERFTNEVDSVTASLIAATRDLSNQLGYRDRA